MRYKSPFLMGVLALSCYAAPLHAQVPLEPHRHPGNYPRIEQLVEELHAAQSSSQDKIVEFGYIMAKLKWSQAHPVKICFIQPAVANETSAPESIERIIALAQQWVTSGFANLSLDFGPTGSRRKCTQSDKTDIRIGFDPKSSNGPNWSLVGHDPSTSSGAPTANFYFTHDELAAVAGSPLAYYFPYTILHEFGHALGFIHEHQGGNCDSEFNFTYLYTYYGWSKEMINANFRHITDPGVVQLTPFCRESVMNYVIDPLYYIRGVASTCYTPPVSQLAECDKRTASIAYPPTGAGKFLAASQAQAMVATAADPATTSSQRHVVLASAAEIAEKAGLAEEIIADLKRSAEMSGNSDNGSLERLRLALSKSASQASSSASSGPGAGAAPILASIPTSEGEMRAILKITDALKPIESSAPR